MPERGEAPDVVRIVEGIDGRVDMRSELRLRFGYGDVVPWVRHLDGMLVADRRPGRGVAGLRRAAPRPRLRVVRRLHRRGRRQRVTFVLTWHPSHQHRPTSVDPQAALDGRPSGSGRTGRDALHLRRPVPRRRRALAAHPQGADLRADRRHRRRGHDLAAGGDRRRAQLGLPLLLAARRDVHPAGAGQDGLHARRRRRGASGCCAPSPAARSGCRSSTASPASAACRSASCPWLAGYEGSRAGADRQRRRRPAASSTSTARSWTRCGWRAPTTSTPSEDAWRLQRGLMNWLESAGRSPTRGCGRCAAAGSTSPTRRCSPGSPPTGRCARVEHGPSSADRSSAIARCATRSTPTCARRASTPTGRPSPSTTGRRRWTPRCCSSRRSASCRPRTSGSGARCAPCSASSSVDGMVRRYDTDDDDDGVPRRRGRVPGLQLLAGRRAGARRPGRRRPGARSSGCSALRNDVGLLAEEYDVARGPPAGQRAAGLQPPRPGQLRPQPGPGAGHGRDGAGRAARRPRRLTRCASASASTLLARGPTR